MRGGVAAIERLVVEEQALTSRQPESVTVLSEYEVRRGKMNLQFKANVENQDRARCERSACERYGIFRQLNGELGLN